MDAETIKDFLISLGFQIDDAGAKKFDSVLAGVTANVFKMATVVEGAALTVTAFTAKIASGLDNLYWASQRTGATVAGIKAIGYAASQTGSSAAAAQGSLESLSRFMRNNPGAEGFLNRLGVQTRDAKGNMRDMSSVFTGVGQQLSKMPYYRANQYASMLGIDENTLMAMRRGLTGFTAEYSAMAKVIGFNADQAAISSNRFMTSLRDFSAMAGMARDKIGSNLADGLAGSIDNLRKQILDNFPKIEDTITRGVKGILWLADAIGRVVFRLIQAAGDIRQWFNNLDTGTQKLIAGFGALLVAWRLLNSAFLASPIGMITALIGSLVLLYDDYKTWKEGGKSLIDWDKWKPNIDAALKSMKELQASIKGIGLEVAKLLNINLSNWTLKGDIENLTKQFGEFGKMMSMIGDLINALKDGNWSQVASIGKRLLSQGNEQPDALPSVTDSANNSADWIKNKTGFDPRSVGRWFRGENGEPDQYGQSVRRPQASAEGSKLLNLLNPTLNKLEGLYQLPQGLLKSLAITESSGDPNALGPMTKSGRAKGLFQFVDGTARDMGLSGNDVFDPVKSAQAAAKYLSQLMKMNGGNLEKTLASYNWGIGNVQKYGMALAPQETRNYVPKVLSNLPGNTLNQETHITVYGSNDPRSTANEIGQRQSVVNSRATQQMNKGPG